jgi:hypothetical protein
MKTSQEKRKVGANQGYFLWLMLYTSRQVRLEIVSCNWV